MDTTVPREKVGGWRVADLSDGSWMIDVPKERFAQVIAAAESSKDRDLLTLEAPDLPLGGLAEAVDEIVRAVEPGVGRGFAILRGLPVAELSEAVASRVYWGIGLRLGEPVSQNLAGEFLCHVRRDPGVLYRGFASDVELHPHCDLTEILGLMCLVRARSGGESSILSLAAIHDALADERPDLLDELYAPLYCWRTNEQHQWERPFSVQPVFARSERGWGGFFNPTMFRRAGTLEGVPGLTPAQEEAITAVSSIANRPEFSLNVTLEPGDMLFAHNSYVMHARTKFIDDDDPSLRRHLLRLWLDRPSTESTVPWPVRFDFRYGNSGLTRRGVIAGQEAVLSRPRATVS